MSPSINERSAPPGARLRPWLTRFAPLIVLAAASAVVLAAGWHRELSLEVLARHHIALESFVADHAVLAAAAFIACYVAAVALSLPCAVYITVTGGLMFGLVGGAAASLVGATVGAAVLFVIARNACGEHLLRRAGPMVERLANGFRQDAFSYLLFLRLVPVFPFFLVNLVAAIAGVRLAPFVAATAIGILPATVVFATLGAGLASAAANQESSYRACIAAGGTDCRVSLDLSAALTPDLIAGLVGLGVLALIPAAVRRLRGGRIVGPAD